MSKPSYCARCDGGIVSLTAGGYLCSKCGAEYNYFQTLSLPSVDSGSQSGAVEEECDCQYPWDAHACYMERRTRGVLDDLEVARLEDEEDFGTCECPCHYEDDEFEGYP